MRGAGTSEGNAPVTPLDQRGAMSIDSDGIRSTGTPSIGGRGERRILPAVAPCVKATTSPGDRGTPSGDSATGTGAQPTSDDVIAKAPFAQSNSLVSDLMGRRGFLGTLAAGTVATAIASTVPVGSVMASNGPMLVVAKSTGHTGGGSVRFDLDHGNVAVDVVVPGVVPVIFETMSPTANDATLVLRVTTMLTHAWFDAIAPYHPTAVGVSSRLGRVRRGTTRARNIAILHASRPVLLSLFPDHATTWSALFDPALPSGHRRADRVAARIGQQAGEAVVADRERDGMNQLGDADGRTHDPLPYADTTGYVPANPPDELRDPSRWQPLLVADRLGIHRSQRFVTPQMAVTRPYAFADPGEFDVPPPDASSWQSDPAAYTAQAERAIAASAALTDEQKMTAELYDNKIFGLGFSALFAAQSHVLDVAGFVEYDFLTNVAAFDAAIAVWHHKRIFDAVRPATAIKFLYGDAAVTAWGGPGSGTVTDLLGRHWQSYLPTADHPEYPSASTALCHAHAEVSRHYFGSDDLDWTVPTSAGSSIIEPGVTPAADLDLHFDTWSDLATACGASRVWGGVHFEPSVTVGAALGQAVGARVATFVDDHLAGTAVEPSAV